MSLVMIPLLDTYHSRVAKSLNVYHTIGYVLSADQNMDSFFSKESKTHLKDGEKCAETKFCDNMLSFLKILSFC